MTKILWEVTFGDLRNENDIWGSEKVEATTYSVAVSKANKLLGKLPKKYRSVIRVERVGFFN